MFDVDLTVDFLLEFGSDILNDFKVFAKETPVIYMNDIPIKYRKRPRKRPPDRDYYRILVSKWKECTQMEKLTILYFTSTNFDLSLMDFGNMVDEMILRVDKCKIEHGTMVGVQAAQSLSEKLQQATLNSFHSSGNKKAAQVGLKRLKEILDASKIPSVVTIGPIVCDDPNVDLSKTFMPRTVSDYVVSTKLNGSSFECKMSKEFSFERLLNKCTNQTFKSCLSFNKRKRVLTYAMTKRKQKNNDLLEGILKGLLDMHYIGVKGVVDSEDDTLIMASRTVPQSGGKTLGEIFDAYSNVDLTKISTNDYVFIQETLGIEAARRYLLNEVTTVLNREGISISMRHLNLIVDNMTYTGEVLANRYSALDINDSIILKSTFQQATTTFCNAAAVNTVDNMKDVSSQIMMGKVPNIGVMYSHVVSHVRETQPKEEEEVYEQHDSPQYAPPSPEYAPISPEYHPSSPVGDYDAESVGWEAPQTPESEPEILKMDLSI